MLKVKTYIFFSAIISFFVAPVNAETFFEGVFQYTAINASCTGLRTGLVQQSSFHPMAVPGNIGNFSALNQTWGVGASSWRIDDGSFTSKYQQVISNSLSWGDFEPPYPTYVLISGTTPAVLTNTTPSITIVGKVKNPSGQFDQQNCIANFRFVGVRKLP